MRADPNRTLRVAELMKRELAGVIQHGLNDPRAQGVTLTAVEVAPDLSVARVYFTTLGDEARVKPALTALNHAAGFLRRELKRRLVLRTLPQLRFHYDESVARGAALTSLIDRAISEDRGED